MKDIAILGSTGSIGENALKVIREFPGRFRVRALSANSRTDLLIRQVRQFQPSCVCVSDLKAAREFRSKLGPNTKLFCGEEGLDEMLESNKIDKVLLAISGSAALKPLLKAIQCGKDIALANKEALVMAGRIIMKEAKKKNIRIIPIDSEQSAIWQCFKSNDRFRLKRIYLTASGGPFRETRLKDLKNISINRVLKHPRWEMGKKISVDSANLMNKGLELLEAMFLFEVPYDKISIIIHPQALVHSMVEFVDGVILAQLSATDMRIPIQYALTYPDRLPNSLESIDFTKLKKLDFEAPDFKKFPCLRLSYLAAKEMGTMPAVLNAANEASVGAFLNKRLDFLTIPKVIEKVMGRHKNKSDPGLSDILEADSWARREASNFIGNPQYA